jgi:hypothetical protein
VKRDRIQRERAPEHGEDARIELLARREQETTPTVLVVISIRVS